MNNTKHITISLFRVSTDSKYLDMIFDCPDDFYFDSLTLEVRYFSPGDKIMKSSFYDISNALFNVNLSDPKNTITKKHWVVRLPLSKIGITVPAIYKACIKALPINTLYASKGFTCDPVQHVFINKYGFKELSNDSKSGNLRSDLRYEIDPGLILDLFDDPYDYVTNANHIFVCDDDYGNPAVYDIDNPTFISCTPDDPCDNLDELVDFAICSDVNYAYRCMLYDLLDMNNICNECTEISDEAIRKYLLLYGHQAALSCGDDEIAETYFKLINNCFSNCGQQILNCGCQKSILSVKNCNCKK